MTKSDLIDVLCETQKIPRARGALVNVIFDCDGGVAPSAASASRSGASAASRCATTGPTRAATRARAARCRESEAPALLQGRQGAEGARERRPPCGAASRGQARSHRRRSGADRDRARIGGGHRPGRDRQRADRRAAERARHANALGRHPPHAPTASASWPVIVMSIAARGRVRDLSAVAAMNMNGDRMSLVNDEHLGRVRFEDDVTRDRRHGRDRGQRSELLRARIVGIRHARRAPGKGSTSGTSTSSVFAVTW